MAYLPWELSLMEAVKGVVGEIDVHVEYPATMLSASDVGK